MSSKLLAAVSVAALQASITTQEGLGFYYVPSSLRIIVNPPLGPQVTCSVSNSVSGVSVTTLTQYNTLALAQAGILASTSALSDVAYGTLGAEGPIFITATNAQTTSPGTVLFASRASGSALSISTGTTVDVTSLTLTRGDWLVGGNVNYALTGATTTELIAGVSASSGVLPTADKSNFLNFGTTTLNATIGAACPTYKLTVAVASLGHVLAAKATFSAGTVAGYGDMFAYKVS